MRTPTISSVQYRPEPVPNDPKQLPTYLQREFNKLAIAIQLLAAGQIEMSYIAPTKPRLGNIRLADGATWNPGAGRGVYWYDDVSATWKLLG